MIDFYYKGPLFIIIIIALLWIFVYWRIEKGLIRWISDHWNLVPGRLRRVSTFCFVLGVGLCFLMLLRPYTPQSFSLTTGDIPQVTAILIDSSASMSAEDAGIGGLSRFKSGMRWVNHLLQQTESHAYGVWLFNRKLTKISPLTEDKELVKTRISAIQTYVRPEGGSDIDKAIIEVTQELSIEHHVMSAHIVVISDGEQLVPRMFKNLPPGYTLSLVLIGSEKGSFIHLREDKKILTQMHLDYGEEWKKYVNSFFSTTLEEDPYAYKNAQFMEHLDPGEFSSLIRYDYTRYVAFLALLFISLSAVIKRRSVFFIVLFSFFTSTLFSQEKSDLLEQWKKGEITLEKKNQLLAFWQQEDPKKALILYEERLGSNWMNREYTIAEIVNYGTILLANLRLDDGEHVYKVVEKKLNEELNKEKRDESLKENILSLMRQNRLQAITQFNLKSQMQKNRTEENKHNAGSSYTAEGFWDKWLNEDQLEQEKFLKQQLQSEATSYLYSKEW